MKLNSSQKYYLYSIKPAVIIFYIVLLVLAIISVLLNFMLINSNADFGGIAAGSMIFLFVAGICSFYEEFKMYTQNGITRNELWKSFLISSIIISGIMSAINLILIYTMSLIIDAKSFVIILSSAYVNNNILEPINAYFLQVLLYTLALTVGYFIRLIYYRMNKFCTITLSIAIVAFLLIGFPIIDTFYSLDILRANIINLLASIISPEYSYGLPMLYLLFIIITSLFSIINRQLIKKAVLK